MHLLINRKVNLLKSKIMNKTFTANTLKSLLSLNLSLYIWIQHVVSYYCSSPPHYTCHELIPV